MSVWLLFSVHTRAAVAFGCLCRGYTLWSSPSLTRLLGYDCWDSFQSSALQVITPITEAPRTPVWYWALTTMTQSAMLSAWVHKGQTLQSKFMGDHGPKGIQNIFWELYILKAGISWENQEEEMVGGGWNGVYWTIATWGRSQAYYKWGRPLVSLPEGNTFWFFDTIFLCLLFKKGFLW